MQPIIELDQLGVRSGKRDILRDLSVALFGRVIGLLGPNGAGKSTLIQTLLGFCPPAASTARVFGEQFSFWRAAFTPLHLPDHQPDWKLSIAVAIPVVEAT